MRQLKLLGLGLLAALVLTACGVQTPVLEDGLDTQAILNATIDFEGLAEGAIVSSVSSGNGISGDVIGGTVAVYGESSDPAILTNAAMIFDATCTDGATGGDIDLCLAGFGNILIISEDLDSTDPDDADLTGEHLSFDFTAFGPGYVTVKSFTVIDVEDAAERNATYTVYYLGGGSATFPLPITGNNTAVVELVNAANVIGLVVNLDGSGAIDNVEISVEEEEPGGGEGCTPGYWKQSQHFDSWVGYTPDQQFSSVFENAFPGMTLLQVLEQGGGGLNALGRHTVAALLNGASGDVSYDFSAADVIAAFNAVYPGGDYEGQKNIFAGFNEQGCPLN